MYRNAGLERDLRCRGGRGLSGVSLHQGTRSDRLESNWRVGYGTVIGAMLEGLRLACKPTYKGSEKSGPFGFSELDTNVRVSRWWQWRNCRPCSAARDRGLFHGQHISAPPNELRSSFRR